MNREFGGIDLEPEGGFDVDLGAQLEYNECAAD